MMDYSGKCLKFANLLSKDNVLRDIETAIVSPLCNNICVITKAREGFIHLLPNNGSVPPVWQCPSKAKACLFSEDGSQIMFLLSVNSIHLYKMEEDGVSLCTQLKASQLSNLLKQYNIDYSSSTRVKPLSVRRQQVTLLVENHFVCVEWGFQGSDPSVKFATLLPSFCDMCLSGNFLFILLNNNYIHSFNLLTGQKSIDEFNPSFAKTTDQPIGKSFSKLAINIDSYKRLAIVNQDETTIIFDIKELLEQNEQKTPTVVETKKEFWNWSNKRKTAGENRGFSGRVLNQISAPSGHVVSQLQFTLNGLLVFYSQGVGIELINKFKILDEVSGNVISFVEGLVESKRVSGGILPLFMNDNTLSLCLGVISNDPLIVRLCEILPDFKVQNIEELSDKCIPFYNSFLKVILSLHSNMFRGYLKSLSLGDERCLVLSLEKIDLIVRVVLELYPDYSLLALVFLHIVHLLDLACLELKKVSKMTAKTEELVVQILDRIVRLYRDVKHMNLLSYEWNAWSTESHFMIVQDAVFLGTVALALVFFTCEADWPVKDALEQFKEQAKQYIAQLISNGDLEKTTIALKNLGVTPNEHFKSVCLETTDPMMRDLLAKYLTDEKNFNEEETLAWQFCKTVETSLSSMMKTFVTFDYKISVSASENVVVILPKLLPFKGSIELKTVLSHPKSWRDRVILELYFNTGDMTLEPLLDSSQCWTYLLEMNQIDLLTCWVDIACSQTCGNASTDYLTKTFLNLLSNWSITTEMLDLIWDSPCMTSTKSSVLDHSASYGYFTLREMNDPKSIVYRLENISALPNINQILSQKSSNVSPGMISNWILKKASKQNLSTIILTCIRNLDLNEDIVKQGAEYFPWLKLWQDFQHANIDNKNLSKLIVDSNTIFPVSSEEEYLLKIASALSDEKELLSVLEEEGANGYLLHHDLFKICWETLNNLHSRNPDVSLYDLLYGSGLAVGKLFQWQSENKAIEGYPNQESFPHFNHQVLCAKYGFKRYLDYMYYLKQCRPSFAANLFIVESFRSRRRITSKMIARACGLAHGLALRLCRDEAVGNACVAFIVMLGAVPTANALRLHLAAADAIHRFLPDEHKSYIGVLMRGIAFKDAEHIQEMANLLEKAILQESQNCDPLSRIRKWMLPVAFCNLHALPLPSSLPRCLAKQEDWFSFILCLDIFKYPYEQAIKLIEAFEETVLKAHLIRAFTRTTLKLATTSPSKSPPRISLEPEPTVDDVEDKDVFKSFITSIYTEVLNTIQTFTDHNIVLPWSCEQNPEEDVLLTLLKCESEPESGRSLLLHAIELQSPVLAVLSTFYQMTSVAAPLVTYLLSSIPAQMPRNRLREEGQQFLPFERMCIPEQMENLCVHFFSTGYFQTFFRALLIFVPDNPLTLFMESIYYTIISIDETRAIDVLRYFAMEVNVNRTNEPPGKDSFFNSRVWILNLVVKLIQSFLTRCDILYSVKVRFLRILSGSEIASTDAIFPNFLLWNQLCEILEVTGIKLDFKLLYESDRTVNVEFNRILDELFIRQDFPQALEVSALLSSNKDKIVLAMWQQAFDELINRQEDCSKLWLDSSSAFKDENVNPTLVAAFYKDLSEKFNKSVNHKYMAVKMCLAWRKSIEDTYLVLSFREESDTIELEQWRCFLKVVKENSVDKISNKIGSSLLVNYWSATKVLVRAPPPTQEENEQISHAIDVLLDQEDLYSALRLSSFFGCENKNLQTIVSCLRAAQGDLSVSELSKYSCLVGTPRKLPSYITVVTGESSATASTVRDIPPLLPLLEQLSLGVIHGASLANRILVCFRLSFYLDLTFLNVAKEPDYVSLLTRFQPADSSCKLAVAADALTLASLPAASLAAFISGRVIAAVSDAVASGLDTPPRLYDINLDEHFDRVLAIVKVLPSEVGRELLSASVHLPHAEAVEVIIRAHDCYTIACNVEGIGRVLRRARVLAQQILQAQQWRYLVRLLVGIGRYSDMGYIFQMLKDNDQFEQVLRKNILKAAGLQLAVSEYLQRTCPENRELSRMVAACFGLHANQAVLWQVEADDIISQWNGHTMIKDTSKNRQQLQLAMDNYSLAANSYVQAGKLSKSLKIAKCAQIVALQIALIGGPCILFLQKHQLQTLLNDSLSVANGKLLADAYEFQIDWVVSLHERWILKGEKAFLNDLKAFNLITPALISRYFQRYIYDQQAANKIKDRVKHLETLIPKENSSPLLKDLRNNNLLLT